APVGRWHRDDAGDASDDPGADSVGPEGGGGRAIGGSGAVGGSALWPWRRASGGGAVGGAAGLDLSRRSDVEEHPNSRTCEHPNSRTRLMGPLGAAPYASDPRRGA